MSKEKLNEFKEGVKDFFLNPERHTDGSRMKGFNKTNVTAVLIAGFVGWLLLTITFGAKIKRALKKVPVLKSLFPKAKSAVRRTRQAVRRYRKK